jgi:hypothetical protein
MSEAAMNADRDQYRLDVIAESEQSWRWQIFEGNHLILQSPAIYSTRADANRAGILEHWELIMRRNPFLF